MDYDFGNTNVNQTNQSENGLQTLDKQYLIPCSDYYSAFFAESNILLENVSGPVPVHSPQG